MRARTEAVEGGVGVCAPIGPRSIARARTPVEDFLAPVTDWRELASALRSADVAIAELVLVELSASPACSIR
jgi:hypothetical protein